MTDTTTTGGEVGEELAFVADPPPFLRITGTYPAAAGRSETVQLELNIAGGELAGGGADGSAKSWFIDFCTFVIDAMRRGPRPAAAVLRLTSSVGLQEFLAEQMRHVEGCDGSCGHKLPLIPTTDTADPAGGEPVAAAAEQTGGA